MWLMCFLADDSQNLNNNLEHGSGEIHFFVDDIDDVVLKLKKKTDDILVKLYSLKGL